MIQKNLYIDASIHQTFLRDLVDFSVVFEIASNLTQKAGNCFRSARVFFGGLLYN